MYLETAYIRKSLNISVKSRGEPNSRVNANSVAQPLFETNSHPRKPYLLLLPLAPSAPGNTWRLETSERSPVSSAARFDAERSGEERARIPAPDDDDDFMGGVRRSDSRWILSNRGSWRTENSCQRRKREPGGGGGGGGGRRRRAGASVGFLDGTSPVSHPKWRGASVLATNTVPSPS